jgi:hypothetical protein
MDIPGKYPSKRKFRVQIHPEELENATIQLGISMDWMDRRIRNAAQGVGTDERLRMLVKSTAGVSGNLKREVLGLPSDGGYDITSP